MHEELVERLHKRIALTTAGSPLQDDLREAADAIEELQKRVPKRPHGRLIDADALISRCVDEKGCYYGYESAVIGEAVESAPTVIEAEEGE